MRFSTEDPPSEQGQRYIKKVYNKITMQIQFVYYKYMIYNVDYKFNNEKIKENNTYIQKQNIYNILADSMLIKIKHKIT